MPKHKSIKNRVMVLFLIRIFQRLLPGFPFLTGPPETCILAVLNFPAPSVAPALAAATLAATSNLAASFSIPAPAPPPCAPMLALYRPRRPRRLYDRWLLGIHRSGSGLVWGTLFGS
eukprot:CCRYP_000149-RA/>CCRYP_000149-RA protein AED:0.20 eAED:0.44 QI:657/0/0.5/1/0/0/2/0/116